jgi:hypothetical protein
VTVGIGALAGAPTVDGGVALGVAGVDGWPFSASFIVAGSFSPAQAPSQAPSTVRVRSRVVVFIGVTPSWGALANLSRRQFDHET